MIPRRETTLLLTVLVTLGAWQFFSPAQSGARAPAPVTQPAALTFRPISYYQESCARCHGEYGNAYAPGINARYDDDGLAKIIALMANELAMATIDPAQTAVQVALHRTMENPQPFVSVHLLEPQPDGSAKVEGEATPESTLTLVLGDQKQNVTLDKHTWTVTLPTGWEKQRPQLLSKLGEFSTTLRVGEQTHTVFQPVTRRDQPEDVE